MTSVIHFFFYKIVPSMSQNPLVFSFNLVTCSQFSLALAGRSTPGSHILNWMSLQPLLHGVFPLTKIIDKTQSKHGGSHQLGDTSNRPALCDILTEQGSSRGRLRSSPLNADWGLISFCNSVLHYNVKSLNPGWEPISHVNPPHPPPPTHFFYCSHFYGFS